MSRTFNSISIPNLKAKIEAICGDKGIRPLLEKLGKDIKVKFDLENEDFGSNSLIGYHTESNGLTYCGFTAGGDWEHPVFFMVYWDGKNLRGYVPTSGNPWNSITKQAYGNDDEKDLQDAKKRFPNVYANVDEIDAHDFDFDEKAIRTDFLKRLTPVSTKN